MATKTLLLLTVGSIALAGCAPGPQTVATLPAPSFAAPVVNHPEVPKLPPVAPAKIPNKTEPAQPQVARKPLPQSGPQDWSPAVKSRPWKWIVVHHSATPAGGAAAFDRMHKAKGWDGLGYDFVIGNGTDTADGQIEVGYRWKQQLTGAHAKTADNSYNEYGIGICLVGNFEVDRPTAAQMASLAKLVGHLSRTYRIAGANVVGHGDTKATDCPGRFMNINTVRNSAARSALAANPNGELLTSTNP
jgi:hypothetical protein